jgi:hypothetical protein
VNKNIPGHYSGKIIITMTTRKSIDRRKFVKMSAKVAAAAGAATIMMGAGMQPDMIKVAGHYSKDEPGEDTRDIFKKCGACSHTFFYILNREFGHPKPPEEYASDPLAGGLMLGHQCGMLWGSALAAGTESFRRNSDSNLAIASTVITTRHIMKSFHARAGSVICSDITGVNLKSKLGIARMMVKILLQGGMRNSTCFRLADKWAPEAIQSATEGLSAVPADVPRPCMNCASEVVRRKGGSNEEMVMVSGFAGGMGLAGFACGALGAAIWMDSLAWCRDNPGKSAFEYGRKSSSKIMEVFNKTTGKDILCEKITGKSFTTIRDHSDFIRDGGCEKVINALSETTHTNS